MTFTFSQTLPDGFHNTPAVISIQDSLTLTEVEYLLVQEAETMMAFEIQYAYHCGPFKEAAIVDDLLVVGHEDHFYLYDLKAQQNILALQMDGYFGNFNIYDGNFYVADSSSLYCINSSGAVTWKNNNLGVDGVIVTTFTENEIYGCGEWDPPGGWIDFLLDLNTGKLIEENQ